METRDSTTEKSPNRGKSAVLLLSGGLDSTTTGAIAKADGFELFALSVEYGQRHQWELAAAQRVAQHLQVREHRIVAVDLGGIGGSALTADIAVPKGRSAEEMGHGIPVTYVPARNTVLLSLAWPSPKHTRRAIFSWASTPSTTAATPTAGRNTSRLSSGWRIWPQKPGSKVLSNSRFTPRSLK